MAVKVLRHLLIVDDHPGIRLLLEEVFTLEGYHVTTASSGREALKKIGSNHFDFLIIDQHLPDMTGTQIVASLADNFKHVPVILISGLTANLMDMKKQYTSIKAVIEKPFNVEVLLDLIKRTL